MDCGIVVDPASSKARCLAMTDVQLGDRLVVGHAGVRVLPEQRAQERQMFEFMASSVSTEKPKGVAIRADRPRTGSTRAPAAARRCWSAGRPSFIPGSVEHLAG